MSYSPSALRHLREHPDHKIPDDMEDDWACVGSLTEACDATGPNLK